MKLQGKNILFVGAVQAHLSQQKDCPTVLQWCISDEKSELGMRVFCGCFETQAGCSGLAGRVTALMALEKEDIPSQTTFP